MRASRALLWCALALAAPARAQFPDDTIELRALGPHVAPEIVRFIAQNARPFSAMTAVGSGTEPVTARAIIGRLCGSLRVDDYFREFQKANAPVPEPDEPLAAARAAAMKWPACLYIEAPARAPEELRPNEAAAKLYTRLTGGGGGEGAAGVETEPADPEEAGSDEAEDQAVGLHGIDGIAFAFAEIDGADQCRYTRCDVNDCAAGKVEAGNRTTEERV